jgi:hypothetical protein
VRVTADHILLDAALLSRQVEYHLRTGADYTFLRKCPEGVHAEVIRHSALVRAAKATDKPVEFISYSMKAGEYQVREFTPASEYRHQYRLTLDYPEDLTVLRILFSALHGNFNTLDIVNFMENPVNSYVRRINHQPHITVYTSAFNAERYIKACADSVVTQQKVDIEYIIVDDGSTDATPARLLEWYSTLQSDVRAFVRLVRRENRGLPATCNEVLDMARGRWVIRVDADDMLVPLALRKMATHMSEDEDGAPRWVKYSALYTGYVLADPDGKPAKLVRHNEKMHPGCCLLLRRAANEVRYTPGLPNREGDDFRARFDGLYKSAFLDEPLWIYRRHADSISAKGGYGE